MRADLRPSPPVAARPADADADADDGRVAERVIADTTAWLEKAVIGLNLCPFAKAVHLKRQIRFVVSEADDEAALLDTLRTELQRLAEADPAEVETTLLIHPRVLGDFLDFNDFLDLADEALDDLGLDGELQVASFHPDYRFEGSAVDGIENHTNRSPYPTLHLLREASIEAAAASLPDAADIYLRNIETLRRLGPAGWQRLWTAAEEAPKSPGAGIEAGS